MLEPQPCLLQPAGVALLCSQRLLLVRQLLHQMLGRHLGGLRLAVGHRLRSRLLPLAEQITQRIFRVAEAMVRWQTNVWLSRTRTWRMPNVALGTPQHDTTSTSQTCNASSLRRVLRKEGAPQPAPVHSGHRRGAPAGCGWTHPARHRPPRRRPASAPTPPLPSPCRYLLLSVAPATITSCQTGCKLDRPSAVPLTAFDPALNTML